MKKIFVALMMIAAMCFVAPANADIEHADTETCVTWAEFKDVNVNGWPATRPGTHRDAVINHFDVRPTSTTQGAATHRYDQRDRWGRFTMCQRLSNLHPKWKLSVFYTFHISPSGKVFKHADRKCWADSPNGGHPNRCWS
jgi:hypothetical protein